MNKNIFVTGIGTGIGKTITSSILARALNYPYWKPIQCGDLHFSDGDCVKSLFPQIEVLPGRYRLKAPESPHAAAKRESIEICLNSFPLPSRPTVIEGAGGVLVPLNQKDLIIDLIPMFHASVVVVAQYYLGSINHTLLTLNELKRRDLLILGIVFNGEKNQESKDIILTHHPLPVLLELPHLDEVNSGTLERYVEVLRRNMHVHL